MTALHKLQIVYDYKSQIRAESAAFCLHVGNGKGRIIVYINIRLTEHIAGIGKTRPLFVVDLPELQLSRIYQRFRGHKAHAQLLLGHFELEYDDGFFRRFRSVQRYIKGEARFAHARSGRHEDKIGFFETGYIVVQLDDACGKSRQASALQHKLVEFGVDILND